MGRRIDVYFPSSFCTFKMEN